MKACAEVYDGCRLSLFFLLGSLPVLLRFKGGWLVMQELASWAVRAVEVLEESLALLGFIILVEVWLLLELVAAMGERAGVFILASAGELPELADLGLELLLETFHRLGCHRSLNLICVSHLLLALDSRRLHLLHLLDSLTVRMLSRSVATVLEVLDWSWRFDVVHLFLPLLCFKLRLEILLRWIVLRRSLVLGLDRFSMRHLWGESRLES